MTTANESTLSPILILLCGGLTLLGACASDSSGTSDEDLIGKSDGYGNPICRAKPKHAPAPAPLRVVTEGAFPPFNSVDANGRPIGWEIDYLGRVMALIGRSYTIETKDWDGCCARDPSDPTIGLPPASDGHLFTSVFRGDADVAIAAISNGAVRQTVFEFSKRYGFAPTAQRFISTQPFTLSSLQDLEGKRIVVQRGTNQFFYVSVNLKFKLGLNVDLIAVDTNDAAVAMLQDGTADMLMGFANVEPTATLIAAGILHANADITQVDPAGLAEIWGEGAAFMVRPNIASTDPDLVDELNCAIDHLATKTKIYDQLNKKWKADGTNFVYCNPRLTDEQCLAL